MKTWTVLPLLALALPLCGGLYPEMKAPFVTWVEGQKPRAIIVAQKPAKGTFAADELNQWLERMTGTKLFVTPTAPAQGPRIYLGGTIAWKKLGVTPTTLNLGNQGYVIRTVDEDLVITGESNLGTLFGVYAFLEHYLGCRWFWPGSTGQVIPKIGALKVGAIDEASKPSFDIRWVMREEDCARFNRCNAGLSEPDGFETWRFVHTWKHLVEPKRYWKEHPEYYALVGGKRADPSVSDAQVNVCTSHSGVLEAVLRTIDEIMAANPGLDMISVDPMDTQKFCQCERCLPLQDSGAPYESRNSRLVFEFTNRVAERTAKKHPRLLIKTIAYHTYLAPPPFKMRENVVIQFCRFMCHNHPLADGTCPESTYFNQQLLAWKSKCSHLMMYEYYNKASWCGLPWPIVHMIRTDLPYLRDNGATGFATQWNHNYANNGLVQYVAAKLLWNPRLEVDALLTDFYQKAYGGAAEPMRRYQERLEDSMARSGFHVAAQSGYRIMHRFFSPELQAALAADLRGARQQASDPDALRRVDLMERGFQYGTLVAAYLAPIATYKEARGASPWASDAPEELAALEKTCVPLADKVKQYIKSKENQWAVPGLGNYEARLLNPRHVAASWFSQGDRAASKGSGQLTKAQWLKEHPQTLKPNPPSTLALWIYGNDLDWDKINGPEHVMSVRGPNGRTVVLGKIGRPDREGNRKNLVFILRGLPSTLFTPGPVELLIENTPGGPYSSAVYAVYVMPDDSTSEDEATRRMQRELEAVRRKAAGFAEFQHAGEPVREDQALRVKLEVPGYPREAFDGR